MKSIRAKLWALMVVGAAAMQLGGCSVTDMLGNFTGA